MGQNLYTTQFAFDFDVDVETINHYKLFVNNIDDLYVGGIMASLMLGKITEATGIDCSYILTGLFTDTSGLVITTILMLTNCPWIRVFWSSLLGLQFVLCVLH